MGICLSIRVAEVVRILLAGARLRIVPFVRIIYYRAMQTIATQTGATKANGIRSMALFSLN